MTPFGPRRAWLYCRIRWGRQVMAMLGIDWVIDNPERLRNPSIFASNHQSFLDVVLLPAFLPPETVIIAKKELKRVPLLGPAFAACGAVLIDRSNPRGAIESIKSAVAKLPKDWSILIFPEGTRSVTGELKRFKKGVVHVAIATKYPVVPIAVHGVREVTRSPRWLPRPGTVRIAVGQAIPSETWTDEAIDSHIDEVRRAVAIELARARTAWSRDTGVATQPVVVGERIA